jgi:eukaryotic-like serine/threonine-protein kinase
MEGWTSRPAARSRGLLDNGRVGLIGRSVRNFEIRSLIRDTPAGSVYLAEHPLIGRKAVLEVLAGDVPGDETTIARFLNEARAANAIRHPHIVELIEVGCLDDGQPYLLMEHLEGETLRERLRRVGRLSMDEAMEVIGPLTSALGAAHDHGIVHGRLEPEKVFLATQAGEAGCQPKVLGFAVARLRGDPTTGPEEVSAPGTAAYLSPEQCRRVPGELDPRSDLYALGTLAYEMLCGRPPFRSERHSDLLAMQMLQAPPPLRRWLPDLPVHVEAVIMRALAKPPADRFADVSTFWDALSRAVALAPPMFDSLAGLTTLPELATPPPILETTAPAGSSAGFDGRGRPWRRWPLLRVISGLRRTVAGRKRWLPLAAAGLAVLSAGVWLLSPSRPDASDVAPTRSGNPAPKAGRFTSTSPTTGAAVLKAPAREPTVAASPASIPSAGPASGAVERPPRTAPATAGLRPRRRQAEPGPDDPPKVRAPRRGVRGPDGWMRKW